MTWPSSGVRWPPTRTPLAAPLLVAYSWWATGLQPFTWPSTVAVVGAGAVAIVRFARVRAPYRAVDTRKARGSAVWLVLAVALGAWQLASYLQHPRDEHPTLSSLANAALDTHPVRALAFAAWLVGAAWLARRR